MADVPLDPEGPAALLWLELGLPAWLEDELPGAVSALLDLIWVEPCS